MVEAKDGLLPSSEIRASSKSFTPETRQKLEEMGYHIYELRGQSIKDLQDAGKPFYSSWMEDYSHFDTQSSMVSEVAVNPDELFLAGSHGQTFAEQKRMVAEFSQELQEQGIGGVKAIIGEVADYVALAFAHLDATGAPLFGENDNYDYASTKTPMYEGSSCVAGVGCFDADRGLAIDRFLMRDVLAWATPLIVPISNVGS